MSLAQKLLWSVYIGAVGTVATMASQKGLKAAWKLSTGEEPPAPNDPATPLRDAVLWAGASAIGVGVAQLVAARFAARRWQADMGTEHPSTPPLKLKI